MVAYVMFGLGFLGYILAPCLTWQPDPWKTAVLFACWGLLFPIRLLIVTAKTRAGLRGIGPVTFEVDPLAITRRGTTRTTRETWAGVADVRLTSRDVIFLYKLGDLSWLPRRTFDDLEHEARFLKAAGMVSEKLWLRPPDSSMTLG